MAPSPRPPRATELPPVSPLVLRFFRNIVRRYFRRHFRAVLGQNAALLGSTPGPLIVYANHGSWWDPMLCVLLGDLFAPHRQHFAPMDAVPLARYGVLRRIGIFPVEPNTARGAVQFLRTAEAVLGSGGVLWVTPQGRFADARQRPLAFKAGLAALVERVPNVTLLPMAIEYTFWNERLPETLLRMTGPLHPQAQGTAAITHELEAALEAAMNHLRDDAMARDPLRFTVLLEGTRGTGGFYALGKRLRAALRGKGLAEDHSARDRRADEARGA